MPDIEDDFTPSELEHFTKSGGEDWAVGNVVEAMWIKGKDEWHPAVIKEVRLDGTFIIDWRDGAPNDTSKTAEQLRPRFKLGSFKELWVHLDENHDGMIDKSEFIRLAPRALHESFASLVVQEGAGALNMFMGQAGSGLPVVQIM
jgi:hypothetical protein